MTHNDYLLVAMALCMAIGLVAMILAMECLRQTGNLKRNLFHFYGIGEDEANRLADYKPSQERMPDPTGPLSRSAFVP